MGRKIVGKVIQQKNFQLLYNGHAIIKLFVS